MERGHGPMVARVKPFSFATTTYEESSRVAGCPILLRPPRKRGRVWTMLPPKAGSFSECPPFPKTGRMGHPRAPRYGSPSADMCRWLERLGHTRPYSPTTHMLRC